MVRQKGNNIMASLLQNVIQTMFNGITNTEEDCIEILDFDTEYTDDEVALWIE